jgi:hypothetical protein
MEAYSEVPVHLLALGLTLVGFVFPYWPHFLSGKFSAERKFCKMRLHKFSFGKNFEVKNFQLLTMI